MLYIDQSKVYFTHSHETGIKSNQCRVLFQFAPGLLWLRDCSSLDIHWVLREPSPVSVLTGPIHTPPLLAAWSTTHTTRQCSVYVCANIYALQHTCVVLFNHVHKAVNYSWKCSSSWKYIIQVYHSSTNWNSIPEEGRWWQLKRWSE